MAVSIIDKVTAQEASGITVESVSNLNNAYVTNGVYAFKYSNTATNRPKSSGGGGLTIMNDTYGVQFAFFNSGTDQQTLCYRIVWGAGASYGKWRRVDTTDIT